MPTKYKDYPIYTYDEPAVYSDFSGGINTDPSNEHLLENEMRDCVNMTYLSGALVKRKGAKKLCDISCEEDIETVQGIFLYTVKLTYIIIAADGKLFYGVYNDNTTIKLTRLKIERIIKNNYVMFDPTDALAGLPTNETESKHDGYIKLSYVFGNDEFDRRVISKSTPEPTGKRGDTYIVGNIEHICIKDYNTPVSYSNSNYFIQRNSTFIKVKETLIFQNYRPIEAATLNDKLYIATGTRILEVSYSSTSKTLVAKPVEPYLCNYTELTKIGYNYMSPYPELAVRSQYNTVTTSISGIDIKKVVRQDGNFEYVLKPVMNFQYTDKETDYYYRWEKEINGKWYVIYTFAMKDYVTDGSFDPTFLNVTDADKYRYRVTFARGFKIHADGTIPKWKEGKSYALNDLVYFGSKVYECVKSYDHNVTQMAAIGFSTIGYIQKEDGTYDYSNPVTLWREVHEVEMLQYIKSDGTIGYLNDYVVDEIDGNYFGQATSVLFNNEIDTDSTFRTIHSCTKVMADGQKLLFYSDEYNSGQWYKTIINNAAYITDRGCLSFKTNKNEEVVKVVPFQGNIIVFANSENIGGSIHLVQGNGDDYNSGDGYYSPYQRKTINASVSCDNSNTVQICDNYLFFKYFNRVYYINASELSNDVVKVTQTNQRILSENQDVKIPWDDNDCISEATDTYYALIWKEKFVRTKDGHLIKERPGIRVKLYYNMANQRKDNTYGMPWLRDESDVFNSKYIVDIKGKPVFLYHNVLLSFNEEYYKDIDKQIECRVHFRGEGLEYSQQYKLIEHIIVAFHRNQFNKVDLNVIIKNEAGHKLLDSDSKRFSINDLPTLKVGDTYSDERVRTDSTIQDMKLFNTVNMFPCLLADTTVTANTEGSFTLSSVTYQYTSCDQPDTNPYDMYSHIIRPKEVR